MNACKAGEIKKIKRIPTLLAAILLLSLALPAMAAVCMWHPRTASQSGKKNRLTVHTCASSKERREIT